MGCWLAVCARGRAAVSGGVPIFLCILPLAFGDLLDCLWAQRPRASDLWYLLESALYPGSCTSITWGELGALDLPYSTPVAGLSYDFAPLARSWCRHGKMVACILPCPQIQPLKESGRQGQPIFLGLQQSVARDLSCQRLQEAKRGVVTQSEELGKMTPEPLRMAPSLARTGLWHRGIRLK